MMNMNNSNRYYGLVRKKECLRLTLRGWFLFFVIFLFTIFLFIKMIHPFLAPNRMVNSKIMIVEGWLPHYVLEKAALDFKTKQYQLLITTGAPKHSGSSVKSSYAKDAAKQLRALGIKSENIRAVTAPDVQRDRTYASAMAVWRWLEKTQLDTRAVTLYSVGAHGRRSYMLYHKAFPRKVRLGVVSVRNRAYDPKKWWKTSNGVKAVIEELVTYLYARLLFHP